MRAATVAFRALPSRLPAYRPPRERAVPTVELSDKPRPVGEGRMFEHRSERRISRRSFARRLLRYLLISAAIIGVSLAVGIVGYEHFEHLALRDAFLNAAMLLGGMGPIKTDLTPAGKVFAGFYALYAGLIFVVAAGVLLAPVVHRLLHSVHCDLE